MSFEKVDIQEVSPDGGDAPLTDNDRNIGVHVVDWSSIEVAYDAKADPEDPAYKGNYRITATSHLRDNHREDLLAIHNGIGPWLGRTGDRLRHELIRYPICHSTGESGSEHPLSGFQKALGLSSAREMRGRTTVDTFTLTAGAENLTAAASKVPDSAWTYGFNDNLSQGAYSQGELEATLAGEGRVIVVPVPEDGDGLSFFDRVVYALHDNSMHVQSTAVLGTPEIQALLRAQLDKLGPGDKLDLDNFFGEGPEIIHPHYISYGIDWEGQNLDLPYYGLRKIISPILASSDRERLLEEFNARDVAYNSNGMQSQQEIRSAFAIMDRPGNMLDQLGTVATSIPRRYIALARLSLSGV